MISNIEKTGLWSLSLGRKDADQELERKRERLRTTLQTFRARAADLTSRIAATFPQLTIHDVTHLDALWETADTIAGAGYPLNPLEAFVFGGAILLHDAAHCFEAYEGGREAVRATLAWRDALASEATNNPSLPTETLEAYADFTAIRLLHARQAERLGQHEWKSADGLTSFFLIEDVELRTRYGALIGQIAASHNWSIEDVQSKLRAQVNAPGDWPTEWRVDPIKIACMLRCADAAHIDNRRAPDFLLALIRKSGVSLDHWKAQNWLSKGDVDQSDATGSSLLFTSTHAFPPHDASAWWVAFDAVAVLDDEIRASNNLLLSRVQRDSSSPAFKIQRVTGAHSPSELKKSIETEGWIPTSAKIHVGNLERLVETLGGSNLYGQGGDNFAVVLRELIQNSRDAIAARRSLQADFAGKVTVKIAKKNEEQTVVEIIDDGIGMSERIMTSALLDFGTSFWTSDLVKSEFPGLRSSSFRPVGKFGIGFYSVFMKASSVEVSSRRFDEGLADVTRLSFSDGLTLRPILAKGADEGSDVTSSTIVRLTVNEPISEIRSRVFNKGNAEHEFQVPLRNYVATIATGLDVTVVLQNDSDAPVTVHIPVDDLNTPEKVLDWLKGITFADTPAVKGGNEFKKYVTDNAKRVRRIEHEGRLLGIAAIFDIAPQRGWQFLTTEAVGGLTNQMARGAGSFIGYMENFPNSAKRDGAKKVAPPEVLQAWAEEQFAILKREGASLERLYWAAGNAANLEIDPINALSYPIITPDQKISLLTFEQTFELLLKNPIPCLVTRRSDSAEVNVAPIIIDGLPTLRPLSHGNLLRIALEDGKPKFSSSMIGCLDRSVREKGRELKCQRKPLDFQTMFGPTDALVISLVKT